ncbi:Formamidopyrimidine-DNA glycosylase N-terminal domain-containing protein [Pseudomassariella vexata]|uniref:Formamidopyrimidine-DNA glycosylase N-terminal domain-domain-containing protein n=1 Tax=Pseudomassariella vexata TaxID=1141098 RepID=A0A1Y2DPR6_9PEZI|nr:Formamidopyrimidine-DNA glycosylase N-terminal domain-containing protein [Pseudomassariella vexata]ORY61281.1 Formamidopyrimidine-DNA glycosylase N-terminal domain-domain-containing protein [Pseudomassariella vexata]
MPEIAEVARVTHFLRLHLVGKKIVKALAPDDINVFGKVGTSGHAFQKAVTGKKVVGAGSQGKYFWILLESPPHPVMHLGMTGWIHIRGEQTGYTRYLEKIKGAEEQWPPRFWKFQLETDSNPQVEVAFTDSRRFGRIRLVDCPGEDIRKYSPLVENGPDPVVDKNLFTEDYLKQKMRSRHVPIKALLLDQAVISGIGNWVGDEIMYQAKLHPEVYCDEFDDEDISTLYKATKYVCDTAVEHLGDSEKFPEHWLFNHRWGKGKKNSATTLPNGEKIAFLTVGGRTSCIVPSVQKIKGKATDLDVEEETEAPEKRTESKFFEAKSKMQDAASGNRGKAASKKAGSSVQETIKKEVEDDDTVVSTKVKSSRRVVVKEEGNETGKSTTTGSTKRKAAEEEAETGTESKLNGRKKLRQSKGDEPAQPGPARVTKKRVAVKNAEGKPAANGTKKTKQIKDKMKEPPKPVQNHGARRSGRLSGKTVE